MSRTIDERVVSMEFDNSRFERNVQTSLGTLDKLKASLNLEGASKGLENVNTAAKSFDASVLKNGVDAVQAKFSALQVMAITALSNITNSAINAGKQLISAFTIDPIKTGFQEYETQINAVQTILANTSSKGTTLDQVNNALDTLNTYADKTIYNFTEMTRNIGTFTAAGLDLDTSVSAIQGIANLAAVSGSTSQQASTAMYQLSQALSAGTVKLQDWNSVVNAGMGGQVFQDALKKTAKAHGVAVDAIIEKNGSFRESLSEGWITSEILSETLSKMTKTGAAEYLSKLTGISQKQIEATQAEVDACKDGTKSYSELAQQMADTGKITKREAMDMLKMADTAEDAATKVKTFSQLMDTLKEAAQSGWTQTWEILVGDFEEAKELWTSVSDYFGDAINNMSQARNDMLQAWADGGGRTIAIDTIKNAFQGLLNILTPIKEAFREVFPPMTAEQLLNITEKVKDLTASFREFTEKHGEQIKSTFVGIFSAIDIGINFVKNLAGGILKLLGSLSGFSGGFLDMTGAIGDWIAGLRNSVKETNIFGTAIDKIVTILQNGIEKIKEFLGSIKEKIPTPGWDGFLSVMQKVWDVITKIGSKIAEVAKKIGGALSSAFRNGDMKNFLDLVNGGLLTGILFGLNKTANAGGIDEVKGLLEKLVHPLDTLQDAIAPVGSMMDELKNCLVSYQDSLKAGTLQKIAISIGILAASLLVLSLIKPNKLTASIAAITALFADLMGGMALFGTFSGDLKVARRSISMMIGLSASILILAFALKTIASVSWEGLVKGVLGVTALMGVMVGAMVLLSKFASGGSKGAMQMVILAVAMEILVDVCKKLKEVDWGEIGKAGAMMGGLVVIAAGLGAVGMYAKKMTSSAIALVILGAAMEIFADVCGKMGSIQWEALGKAGAMMGGVLIFAAGLAAIGMYAKKMMSSSIALIIIAASAEIFAHVCGKMSEIDWSSLGKAGAMMGGVLIFAAGLAAIGTYLGGLILSSVALVIMAGSMEIFADVCSKFGSMDWGALAKAGAAMAGILVLAAGFALLAGMAPSFIISAAGLVVMAGALAILAPVLTTLGGMSWGEIAKGLLTMAAAFAIFGVAGALLSPVIPAMLGIAAAFALLGVAAMSIGAGIMLLAAGFAALAISAAAGATALVAAISVIVTGLLGLIPTIMQIVGSAIVEFCNALIAAVPAILECLGVMLTAFLGFIVEFIPKIVDAGLKLILGLLQGIRDNIQQIVEVAIEIIVNFIQGITAKIPDVIQAGYDLIIQFIEGLATAIDTNTSRLISAIEKLFTAIINAAIQILTASISGFKSIGSKIMNSGFVQGIKSKITSAVNTVKSIPKKCLEKIKEKIKDFKDAGKNLVKGLIDGIKGKIESAKEAASNLASSVIEKAKSIFQIHSPSRVFRGIGRRIPEGMKIGITDGTKAVLNAVSDMCNRVNSEAEGGLLGLTSRTKKAFREVKNEIATESGFLSGVFNAYSNTFVELENNKKANDRALKNAQRTITNFTKALYMESEAYKQEAAAVTESKNSIADYNKQRSRNKEDLSETLGTSKKYKNDKTYDPIQDAKDQIKNLKQANKAIDKAIKKNDSKLNTNRSNKQSRKNKAESFEATGTLSDDELASLKAENNAYDENIAKMEEYLAANKILADTQRDDIVERIATLKALKSENEEALEADRTARAENTAEHNKELSEIKVFSDAKVNAIKEESKAKKKDKKANEKRIKELQAYVDTEDNLITKIKEETKAYKSNVAYLDEDIKHLKSLQKQKRKDEKGLKEERKLRKQLGEANIDLEKKLAKAQKDTSEAGRKKVETIQNEISANNKSITSSKKRTKAYKDELDTTKKSIKTTKRYIEDVTEALNANMQAFYEEFHGNIASAVTSFLDPFNVDFSSGIEDILEEFDGVSSEALKSRTEILDAMKSNVDGIKKMENNLKLLAEHGASDALLDYLKSLGPSAVNEIQTFVQMTNDELEQANLWIAAKQKMEGQSLLENYREQAKVAKEWAKNFELVAQAGFDPELIEEIAGKGIEEGNKFMNALLSLDPTEVAEFNKARENALVLPDKVADRVYASLVYAGSESAEAYRDALKKGLETKDDDQAGRDIGEKMMKNMSSAIVDNVSGLITSLTGVTIKGKKAAKEKVKEAFPVVGKALINGFAKGIKDNESTLSQKITNMAKNAVKVAKTALGIHSPSRVFADIGSYVPMGFAMGIDNESGTVDNSIASMAETAVENAKGIVARISDVVNSDTEVSPTITPVLDFSNMGDGNMTLGASISAYLSKPVDSLSQVISNAQAEINASNNEVIAAINGLRADLNALYSEDDTEIALYVDSKKLASSLAKPMNRQLNILSKRGAY